MYNTNGVMMKPFDWLSDRSWHTTSFQRLFNVIWTLWTLDGRLKNVGLIMPIFCIGFLPVIHIIIKDLSYSANTGISKRPKSSSELPNWEAGWDSNSLHSSRCAIPVLTLPSWYTTLFQRSYNVLWTLDGRCFNVLYQLGSPVTKKSLYLRIRMIFYAVVI